MPRWLAFLVMTLLPAIPAAAQTLVISPKADAVNVSVFRDPNRSTGGEIDLNWLEGFALISETRMIDVPAGDATIRFEGVAEGMVAVSAIVTGLPGGVVQKNRDAALLSPASLLDGSLGNRVHLRRTDAATGKVTEDDAVIRSRADGAVVLQTAAGFEAVRCTGLNEAIRYDGVPAGLSATPVLSVDTRSTTAARATVTLTYLATGFDWTANYVARVGDDGRTLDLMAWLTVANSNGQSFADARLMALAGTLNIDSDFESLVEAPSEPYLYLRCFPLGSGRGGSPAPQMVRGREAPMAAMMEADGAMDIIVTASKREEKLMSVAVAITAVQENLGDLKLYRVPETMTVAANAQKQVALLVKDDVPFDRIHRLNVSPDDEGQHETELVLRMTNKDAKKLGVPLPSGRVAVFEAALGEVLLAGQGDMRDHAVGEVVNLMIGESAQVQLNIENCVGKKSDCERYEATLTNANPFAVTVEVGFDTYDDDGVDSAIRKLPRKDGMPTWTVIVPANGSRTLAYRVKD
ncbi:MAG: hypothetical protein RLZZ58_2343 [Pseudomonadota bacterium]